MDDRTFETLDLDLLARLLARHAQTAMGRKRALSLKPSTNRAWINQSLDLTTECVLYLNSGERFGLAGLEDPETDIAQMQVEGTTLDPRGILRLERLIAVGMDLHNLFRDQDSRGSYPLLSATTARIPDLRRLLASIRGKILPGGEIDDNASPELRAIRRDLAGSRARIHRALESILRGQTTAVQDEIITFRNGRFVIPVRTDSRGQVPGVVHGLSSSGQTTFVEPLSVIEQNNDLVRLRELEETEIARILLALTEALRANLTGIEAMVAAIEEIDLAQAKGLLSVEFGCVAPEISESRRIVLSDAVHILLEQALRRSGERAVPISLELDEQHHVLVVSGPNAGGKTVVVKTAGLIALMAQMGLHVPARKAVLPVFQQVFADIGDQQSIAANLSTFTAHMRNVAEMASSLGPAALVLLDEVGTGTDPDEGAALAIAIVDYFRAAGAAVVATTHYPSLKIWASQTEGVMNASVEFDEQTLRPTYRLILGIAGASSGIEIARRMHVPREILESAQSLVEPVHAEARRYLKQLKDSADEQKAKIESLEAELAATARERARLEEEFARREALRRAEFDNSLSAVLSELNAESEKSIQEIRERAQSQKLRKFAAARTAALKRKGEELRAQVTALQAGHPGTTHSATDSGRDAPATPPRLAEGDRVKVLSLDREGTVESVHQDACTVKLGALRFRTEISDLQLVERPQPPPEDSHLRGRTSGANVDSDETFVPEIKVIGMTADEAIGRVNKFLDEAFLAGAENIRIIHGHGKGILRRAIAGLLKDHPQVERFALAPPEQGGGGATLVEMRK